MPDVTPADVGEFVMYSGMNYDNTEIAEVTGFSAGTVGKYLNAVEDEAKGSDDPESVYWSYVMATVFDDRFREQWGKLLSGM